MREVAVIGVGSTIFGKYPTKLATEMGLEAASAAIKDCQIEKNDIQVAYASTVFGGAVLGQRILNELGISGIFFGTEGSRDKKDFIKAAEGAAEGAYVYHFAPDIYSISVAADYVKKYESTYEVLSGFGPPAYEAMNILLTAIDKAAADGDITRKEVVQQLQKTENYQGILGFPVTFDAKGDLKGGATYFFQVVGDDFKQVAVMTGK